jgi:3-oxoacyl-[acyl-carrier protein] reductase
MTTLRNKTALVTGASRGIGRAAATALAEAGARVVVRYGRSVQEAESLVAEIRKKGGHADAFSADQGTPEGASLLAKQVRSIIGDRLNVLVLNTGISKLARIADHTVEDFDNLFATKVRGPFFPVQQMLPVLGEGTSIVVVSSLGARMVVGKPALGNPSILAYASTKGALETLVKNSAAILGHSGIRVNAVAPGVIDTDMSSFTKTNVGREVVLGMQALKRIGKPEDVADVLAFLASDGTGDNERVLAWNAHRGFRYTNVQLKRLEAVGARSVRAPQNPGFTKARSTAQVDNYLINVSATVA